jgi:cytochrome b
MRERGFFWVRIWDAPTRLFHWGIIVMVAAAWLTQELGWMTIHMINGYAVFAALLFRFAWGFVGSETARFRKFLKSPARALAHLAHFRRREPDTEIGHNAAGGWMVLVILVLLAVQVGTGLCATDDVMFQGPFSDAVGQSWSDWLTHIHSLNFTVIEIAILLHVVAVGAYAVGKRHDLVRPMISGWKRMPAWVNPPRMAGLFRAAVVAAMAGLIVAAVVGWA